MIKNQMQFVYLQTFVSLYLVCGLNFLQLGPTFCRNEQKKDEKANRKKFKCRQKVLQRCNWYF